MSGTATSSPTTETQGETEQDTESTDVTSSTDPTDATDAVGSSSSTAGDESSSSSGPAPLERILMFTSAPVNGNLLAAGGLATARASADALCAEMLDELPEQACTNVHALLSVNTNDEIQDMPTNYGVPEDLPIEGPTGVEVDANFAGLLDGSVAVSPVDAEVASGEVNLWTGSGISGEALNTTCNGWTATEGAGPLGFGSVGNPSNTTTWIAALSGSCNGANQLICICW